MSLVTYSSEEEGIGVISLSDAKGQNKFSKDLVSAFNEALVRAGEDHDAKVCIIRGLPKVFCAGADEMVLGELLEGKVSPYDLTLAQSVVNLPIPTIAEMQGHAVGGGLILGLACDLVMASWESRYGVNFMDLGFTPGMGSTCLLEMAVGPLLAAEMMFGGKFFRGRELAGRASFNYIGPANTVRDRSLDLARRIAMKPRGPLSMLKRTLSLPKRKALEEARTLESLMHEVCFSDPETKARISENYLGAAGKKSDVEQL